MRPLRTVVAAALLVLGGGAVGEVPGVRRFTSGEPSRFANVFWLRTGRGSVLVDAPFLAADTAALGAEMGAAGALPLGAAILTGGRPESSWGLGALVSPATRVWGARSTARRLEASFHGERERLLRAGIPFASMPRTPPILTNAFSGSLNLGFEGYTLRLLEVGEAGDSPSTIVFVPETGELFAGELVWNRVFPVTRGEDLGAWRRELAGLKRLRPRVVYPGHGEPGGVELLDGMAAWLETLEEAVRPLASRSSLSARDVASLRAGLVRKRSDWLLPSTLETSLRAEHARLRRLLAGGG